MTHNPQKELSEVFKQHFQLKEIAPESYFRLIPSGNLGLFDYDRGLCWLDLSTHRFTKEQQKSIMVIIGNVDDGLWRAETTEIATSIELNNCLDKLRTIINDLTSLPTSQELSVLLSTAVHPYLLHGEFE